MNLKTTFLAVMLAATCLFMACDKESPTSTNQNLSSEVTTPKSAGITVILGTRGEYDPEGFCCVERNYVNCQMIRVIYEEDYSTDNSIDNFTQLVGAPSSSVATYFNSNQWADWIPNLDNNILSELRTGNYIITIAGHIGTRTVYQAVLEANPASVLFSFCIES